MRKRFTKWIFLRAFALTAVVFSLLAETNRGGDPSGISAEQTHRISESSFNGEANTNVEKSVADVKFSNKSRTSFRGPSADRTVLVSQEAVYGIVGELKKRIAFPFKIKVVFKECGAADSYYDNTGEIVICYELIETYHYLFSRTLKESTAQNEATKGATVAMFLHEFAHALIDGWDLPVTGREEDAADQFSTLLLINDIPDGNKMALDSARVFKLLADLERGHERDYSDAHSLDAQRFFNTVCLVYGHRPVQYEYLIRNGTLPAERAFDCEEEYARVNKSWQTLLAPHLANSSYQLEARLYSSSH